MKLLVLTAIIAAVASSPLIQNKDWPWRVGKEYVYDVETYTWTKFDQSTNNGNTLKMQFIIRVVKSNHLMVRIEKPLYAKVHVEKITHKDLPSDLKYQPIQITDQPFEIFVDGGRVTGFDIPSALSHSYENVLKGIISALQVDVTPFGQDYTYSFSNSFDNKTFQGLFKKMEADVTGNCETLYSVSPVSAEWRRELPKFATEEDPVEIIKSKNYGICQERVDYKFGVPEGALMNGIAMYNGEKQFIRHTTESRLVVGKQGTIFKSQTVSSVFVSPLITGKQNSEVYSYVKADLSSVHQIIGDKWEKPEKSRHVESLLFSMSESKLYFNSSEHSIAQAQKLLQEMTPLLKNQNKLPKSDFLSKFNILVRIISSMNLDKLTLLTNSVKIAKSSKNVAKTGMWFLYRDAVAQAGTVAAFEQIKSWILKKEVQGMEASELVSTIGNTLRYHTNETMAEFFDLAMNPEVIGQQFLNNSALLAATTLIRFREDELYITNTVIPRLSKELKQAVDKGDSNKAQVYVRVIGNFAYSDILNVFAPYLDGRIPVTKYLRIQMIASLKNLAELGYDNIRSVLYSILKNTAEPYEVRVVAAINLFMASPTPEMMQIMAYMTNEDPSTQVRAVLKSSIINAAGLKHPRFLDLALTAQSVKDSITKEEFGYRYSLNNLTDEYLSEYGTSLFTEMSFIGKVDNILSVFQRLIIKNMGTGGTEEMQATLSISGAKQLLEYISQLISRSKTSNIDFKYSAKKIIELLNIKRKPRDPLEGALFFEYSNEQTLITFNEETLKDFIADIDKNMDQLLNGIDVQYTNVWNEKQMYVVFPLASGMPFIFEYIEPQMLLLQGQTKIDSDTCSKTFIGALQNELNITYARNLDGKVGFLDTIGDEYTVTGVINKLQFYIPIKLHITSNPGEIKWNFKLPEHDSNIFHWSVWPYSSLLKLDSRLMTLSENPATKFIERPAKVKAIDSKFGDWFGMVYQLQGYSYSTDFKETAQVWNKDFWTNINTFFFQKDVALTQFNIKYLAKETTNKNITVSVFFANKFYNQKVSGELSEASLVKDVTANSMDRREELAKRVALGIDAAEVQLVDLSLIFDGQRKTEYVFTAAIANSFVDNKVQGAFFYNSLKQINGVFKIIKPKVVPLNFNEAIKNNITVTFEADLKYGVSENLQVKGYGVRTDHYTKMLLNDPMGKQCLQESSKHNLYQKDCYNMIIKAHAPDLLKATFIYNDTYVYSNPFNNTFEILKQQYLLNNRGLLGLNYNDLLEITSQAFYYDNYYNYEFRTNNGVQRVDNVKGTSFDPYIMAIYAPITSWERYIGWNTGYLTIPFCTVDDNKVWTFSGRSYNYTLTSSWHVVMVDESNDRGKLTDLVILARRPSEKQEEVYIAYKTDANKYVEVEIKPTTVKVNTNTVKVSEGALTTYWNKIAETPLLQYYTLADGILVFNINNGALRLIYDSHRLVIFTEEHGSSTRGICGQGTTEIRDDYITPWGLVDLPEHYGASFTLDDGFSDPKTAELKKEAKLKAYQPVTKFTYVVLPDNEWGLPENVTTTNQSSSTVVNEIK